MYSVVEGTRNLVDKVRHRVISGTFTGNRSSFGSTINLANECGIPSRANSMGYTELMEGSVPCPSCKGSGRIPKGRILFNLLLNVLLFLSESLFVGKSTFHLKRNTLFFFFFRIRGNIGGSNSS